MADLHPTDHRGLKAVGRPVVQASADESVPDEAVSCSDHNVNQSRHDSRYWQGACPLIEQCRLGLLEGRVASWRGSLEESSSGSNMSAGALRRHESVMMLPYLFSNLTVTRTRSEPCICEKDFLKITLPLPGELNCEGNVSFAGHPESLRFQKLQSRDSERLTGLEKQQATASGSVITSFTSVKQVCDKVMTMTDISSRSPSLWDGDESKHNNAGPTPDIIEVSNMPLSSANLQKPGDDFIGAESSTLELVKDQYFGDSKCFAENSTLEVEEDWNAGDSSCCAASGHVEAPRTSHWDDWWSYQLEDFSLAREETEQHRNVTQCEGYTFAMGEDVDEDVLDEGYIVLDEQEEKQLATFSKNEFYHETRDGGTLEHAHHVRHDCGPVEWHSGNQIGYQEDDIWADEQFVSSQAKGFPPPISILANETHPGLPSHVPKTLWRSVKRNGRFVLQEVQARPREFFQATREYGRLRLQLVRPDSESTESYTETAFMEDKEGPLAPRDSAGNFGGISHGGALEIETPGAGPNTALAGNSLSQKANAPRVEDEESRGPKHGNMDCTNSSQGLTLLPLLFDQFGATLQQEHSGAETGQRVGGRTTADGFRKDFIDQGDLNAVKEGSCSADHTEETLGERVCGEGLKGDIMAQDLREIDVCNQASELPHGRQVHYRQDYQHPRYTATYRFDNNLSVLSPTQALMQLPIQSAVR
ncbi:hypothetical protein L7F22_025158 [Adiantum nelumboides]|nr:hypothetical protein [Adiantum nelumboides]